MYIIFINQYWHHGYAIVAAKKYGFEVLMANALYSIIHENYQASINVAKRNGMKIITSINKHYYHSDMLHLVYRISRKEYYDQRDVTDLM